ncbi:MAG: nitroreductase [Reyranella sp.]|uniref:nitroreductase family protein n=1 Tax=Reyranella sp. TaxID=1929291 RepID=UPI0012298389|nr:nitroreductase family protein [Reyranella sp.]TAJ92856.1 MAG: nitroreductase [Reyranella sp.]TBR28014.1 MAG: nitroreductase [Reyranella sp.]
MPDITHAREPRLLALDQLLARRSVGLLQEPAPEGADLDLILDAGLRAPDHGRLKPWRFVIIRDEARLAYGEKLVEAVAVRDPANAATLAERYRAWVRRTPMLIAVGAIVKPGNIPEIEQLLAAGAAAMNMLNAAHMLGYGAMWVTGPNAYDPNVNRLLGFEAPSRLVGHLTVGTPAPSTAPAPARPDRAAHVTEWRPG